MNCQSSMWILLGEERENKIHCKGFISMTFVMNWDRRPKISVYLGHFRQRKSNKNFVNKETYLKLDFSTSTIFLNFHYFCNAMILSSFLGSFFERMAGMQEWVMISYTKPGNRRRGWNPCLSSRLVPGVRGAGMLWFWAQWLPPQHSKERPSITVTRVASPCLSRSLA